MERGRLPDLLPPQPLSALLARLALPGAWWRGRQRLILVHVPGARCWHTCAHPATMTHTLMQYSEEVYLVKASQGGNKVLQNRDT